MKMSVKGKEKSRLTSSSAGNGWLPFMDASFGRSSATSATRGKAIVSNFLHPLTIVIGTLNIG